MAKQYRVIKTEAGYTFTNAKGEIMTDLVWSEKWQAALSGHHWSHAPTTFKRLGFKKVETGSNYRAWKARPFWGIEAYITKHPHIAEWSCAVTVDGNMADARADTFKTREAAADWVATFGSGMVYTRNILNPDAGEFPISRAEKGGCTDPGTERYHCM